MGTRINGEECCLRWTDHPSVLHGVFCNLLTSEKFADVTLFCEGMSLKCHKFILSACSPYFDQILSENNCDHPVIILKDVSYWEMQALLQFVYKGELNVEEKKLDSLIKLAKSLHIKGIGEFKLITENQQSKLSRKRIKIDSPSVVEVKPRSKLHEYLTVGNNINAISERLLDLPPETQPLINETLTTSLDSSDYGLQETEVEYGFEQEPVEVGQTTSQQILVEYSGETSGQGKTAEKKDLTVESEADISSDASLHNVSITPVYKQYTEQNLLAAIKAVLTDGMKQVEACIKFGIPFTTLTRKIRLYKACGGRLPLAKRKEKPRTDNVPLTTVVATVDNDLDLSSNVSSGMETEGRVVLVIEEQLGSGSPHSFQAYKQYSEEALKEAISAVLENGMRATEASTQFGIPLTTLTRKVRSFREGNGRKGSYYTHKS